MIHGPRRVGLTGLGTRASRRRRAEAPRLRACGPCPHGDPTCPCQDGDVCHYVATADTPAMACPRTGKINCMDCV